MSSSKARYRKSEELQWSMDEVDSDGGSEEPFSSVIRLPRANVNPDLLAQGSHGAQINPPPLPPKPAFARSNALQGLGPPPPLPPKPSAAHQLQSEPQLQPGVEQVTGIGPSTNAAPPLPPKPENVRGEKIVELSQRRQLLSSPGTNPEGAEFADAVTSSFLPPPTRPLPAIPTSARKPSYGEEGSWVPSFLDDRSQFDPPQPPEPTIISEGEPIRNNFGNIDATAQSFSDQVPSLTLPLPSPPYTAENHRVSSLFPPLPSTSEENRAGPKEFISLSAESAEDSHIGAIVLSRERMKNNAITAPLRGAPVPWNLYAKQKPGDEAWSVLRDYLTNESLKTHGRNRALQLLTGYVVGACLESEESGLRLLSEIVGRMRGAERSERDGSIFTLIMNIAAHASFVHKHAWPVVEGVSRRVFSDVVEAMFGRQDDDVMWERALRCFLVLLKSSNSRPSDDISSRCLAALALHIGDLTHPDVDHVLVAEGIFPRLRRQPDERIPSTAVSLVTLDEIGGINTVLTIYADTASLSVRHAMFRIVYDIAVFAALGNTSGNDLGILKEHIIVLSALFETYEMADTFVHAFRVGPWPTFVIDTIRMLLFEPLNGKALEAFAGMRAEDSQSDEKKVLHEKTESFSHSETRYSSTIGRVFRTSAMKHVNSIRTLVKWLDKPFCLRVIQQLERMAAQHSKIFERRETMHFTREWKIRSDMETALQLFIFSREDDAQRAMHEILTKLYVAVVDITSGRTNMRSVLRMAETVIEFFTVKMPFSKSCGSLPTEMVDSIAGRFLKGQLMASRELLRQANPSIFTLLLLASKSRVPSRRLSECRQCLVEFLGSKHTAELLQTFVDDHDSAVAYRALELVSKYSEAATHPGVSSGAAPL